MNGNNNAAQISFDLKDDQLKSIEASRELSSGKITIKSAIRAGAAGAAFDCIFFARNAPFAPEHV